MRIGHFAEVVGLSASAIRYYEREGLLPPARRLSGRRDYTLEDVRIATLVRMAREMGMPIGELRAASAELRRVKDGDRPLRSALAGRIAGVEAEIVQLLKFRDRLHELAACTCVSLATCPQLDPRR